jgi:hypothetical protein
MQLRRLLAQDELFRIFFTSGEVTCQEEWIVIGMENKLTDFPIFRFTFKFHSASSVSSWSTGTVGGFGAYRIFESTGFSRYTG